MVIIKDFDAPRNCVNCQNEGLSEIVGCGLFDECGKHPNCPFIEVNKGACITNGDMIKAMFPNAKFNNAMPFTDNRWETIDLDTENKTRGTYKPTQLRVYADWWNAPYTEMRGGENEIN